MREKDRRRARERRLTTFSQGEWQIYRAFHCCNLYKAGIADGPVAQGIEQQPSKLKVAGSNPAGVATKQIENIECSRGFAESGRNMTMRTLGDQSVPTGKLRDIESRKKSRSMSGDGNPVVYFVTSTVGDHSRGRLRKAPIFTIAHDCRPR